MNALQPEQSDPEAQLAQACAAVRDGHLESAAQICRALLDSPNLACAYQAAMLLGDVLAGGGHFDAATQAYRRAEGMAPGVAAPDTRIACMRLRQELGTPPIPPPLPGPKIQMTSLGSNGRFGNQILQYGFLRVYANRLGIRFEAPEWIGRYLFASDYPLPATTLPRLEESATDLSAALRGTAPAPVNCDVWGYLCQDTGSWGPVAAEFRALFEFAAPLKTRFEAALAHLRQRGRTLVALHIRRGDFGYGSHWVAPVSWYLDWLRNLWPQLEAPVLFIATDDPRAAPRFAEFSPVLAADLPVQFAAAPFALDHFLLANADHLAVSNSTFSFTAALLNATATGCVRPDPEHRGLRNFDPWRSLPLLPPMSTTDALPDTERTIIEKWIQPGTSVVHVGPYCSGWTLAVRAAHPALIVHEVEPGESLETLLRTAGHVNHLRLDRSFTLDDFFRDAHKALQHARVDMAHIEPRPDAAVAVQRLQHLDYAVFDAISGQPLASGTEAAQRHLLALHRRLLHLMTQSGSSDLDLAQLCREHSIRIDTVVHVGAHEGQELPTYDALGARQVVFIEANPAVYARLEERMRARADVRTVLRAVSDAPGTITLHLASFDQSSSVLPMGMHQSVYPGIRPSGTVEVAATPLDDLLQEIGVDPQQVSMLVIDVQGAEQLVLRGASRVLDCADCVQVEISFAELYRGGAQIEDVEQTLCGAGLHRTALLSGFHTTWGDAFYVRSPTRPTAAHS